ncbi:MAG: carboxypeptidase-like regulatory domain-containing protein [Bacteroidia bacterium]|nr:carboxypeptidase-like regulatory domain-containing protein [Bacteroidia bacterium]
MRIFLLSVYLFLLVTYSFTQSSLEGKITDINNKPIPGVSVYLQDSLNFATTSDTNGYYKLILPPGTHWIVYKLTGKKTELYQAILRKAEKQIKNMVMVDEAIHTGTVQVKSQSNDNFDLKTKDIEVMPIPAGGIEKMLRYLPGVVSNNEFSSQYSVRGGNFDENLIYVNDIEVYRPFMIRSGQQEGLGFVNPDLTESIYFSTGGFESKYGDKMSSVLAVEYKKPEKLAGSVQLGVLGANIHVENRTKNEKLSYLLGVRYASTRYLLNSLDTKGNYQPTFTDIQSWIEYKPAQKFSLGMLNTYARNNYQFYPTNRETTFGTIKNVLRLFVAFEGQEFARYSTFLNGIVGTYKPNFNWTHKWIVSTYFSKESEVFDVEGGYRLCDVNANLGNEGFNECIFNRGIGTYYQHARNFLNVQVIAGDYKAAWVDDSVRHKVEFGTRAEQNLIFDTLKEWNAVDSADFVSMGEYLKTNITLQTVRWQGYAQYKRFWRDRTTQQNVVQVCVGARTNYWSYNHQLLFSPRVQFTYTPQHWKRIKKTGDTIPVGIEFRVATGLYQQPPFYRELRNRSGVLNPQIRAQTSIHYIAGTTYNLKIWNRPFKIMAEAYYKQLFNLIPYDIENVRIRYFAQNNARGYATGFDFRINGEFVRTVESWFSLSIMQTKEDIQGDKDIQGNERGYILRPTNQTVTAQIVFQDYLPKNPTIKANLALIYGSGLPFGPPNNPAFRSIFTMPAYRRVDVGISKLISYDDTRKVKSIWIGLEVFNVFQIANTVSYIWIEDVFGTQFGVPNYLSQRLLNLRVQVKF